jgi:hypothetical protein
MKNESPRLVDFALWATAYEEAFRPAGTSNPLIRKTIDVDRAAALVREIMAERAQWTGSASYFCRSARTGLDGPRPPRTRWPTPAGSEGRLGTRTDNSPR